MTTPTAEDRAFAVMREIFNQARDSGVGVQSKVLLETLTREVESAQADARAEQRQTIDALTVALTVAHETMQEVVQRLPELNGVSISVTRWYRADEIVRTALEKARGESSQRGSSNPETSCANCGSRTFVYLQSGKRQCVVCKD